MTAKYWKRLGTLEDIVRQLSYSEEGDTISSSLLAESKKLIEIIDTEIYELRHPQK